MSKSSQLGKTRPQPYRLSESMFPAMRILGEWVDRWDRESRQLQPSQGTIGIGNADFEYVLKYNVGLSYLSALRRGLHPLEAKRIASVDGTECVRIWNERTSKGRASFSGRFTLQVWDKSGESVADFIHSLFMAML